MQINHMYSMQLVLVALSTKQWNPAVFLQVSLAFLLKTFRHLIRSL